MLEVSTIGIIFKFVLRNIYEKKFRTFLIVFSIMISSALFFASTAISGTLGKMYADRLKQYFGTSDIIIQPGEKSPSSFFLTEGAEGHKEHFDYIIGVFHSSAVYKPNLKESLNLSVLGVDYDDLQTMNPFSIYTRTELKPFTGKKIIISKSMAEKYNLSSGDTIDLDIWGTKHKFSICAIAYPSGTFVDDGMTTYAAIPKDFFGKLYNARGKANTAYLKLKNPDEKTEMIDKLSNEYKKYTVREPFSLEELNAQTAPMTMSFFLMTIIVFIMSVFIIYSSFKVLTMERLPVIGTFRSIGATRKMTDLVLLAESLVYGVIGGVLGCGLGVGILYIMSYLSKPVWIEGFKASVEFSPIQLIVAFLVAVFIGLISSIVPIIKVSKLPVKDIVLNSIDKKHKKKRSRLIFAIPTLIIAVLVPPLIPPGSGPIVMFLNVILMILSIICTVLLIPYVTNIVVMVFEKAYSLVFGNEGVLAAKNLKENKSIYNNISLLAIGISSLLMINTVSFSVGKEVVNVYSDMKFDIWLSNSNSSRNFEALLQTVEGVQSVIGVYEANNVEVADKNSRIMTVQGIDQNNYLDYFDVHMQGSEQEVLNEIDDGRNILLTNTLKEGLGVEKGDVISLKLNGGTKQYKVIGFFNTLMQNGSFALVSEKYLKADAKLGYYSQFFVKTNISSDKVEKNIKNTFPKSSLWMMTMDKMEELNMQSNSQMFSILNGFSIMALIIGIFGVLNNFIISFIERKRSLAVLRSVGMEKKQIVKMLFIESLTGGIIGGMAGIAAGLILLFNVAYVMKAMSLPVAIHYSLMLFANSMLGGIIITLAASISPALKSSKMNIIESIKYE